MNAFLTRAPSTDSVKALYRTTGCQEVISLDRKNSGVYHSNMPEQGLIGSKVHFVGLFDNLHGYYRNILESIRSLDASCWLGSTKSQ